MTEIQRIMARGSGTKIQKIMARQSGPLAQTLTLQQTIESLTFDTFKLEKQLRQIDKSLKLLNQEKSDLEFGILSVKGEIGLLVAWQSRLEIETPEQTWYYDEMKSTDDPVQENNDLNDPKNEDVYSREMED